MDLLDLSPLVLPLALDVVPGLGVLPFSLVGALADEAWPRPRVRPVDAAYLVNTHLVLVMVHHNSRTNRAVHEIM